MSDSNKKDLYMKFDPNVIDDLGAKLYKTLPPVISELVANSYDACATRVEIELLDSGEPGQKEIIVRDNGIGMSLEQVGNEYLVVGRKRRKYDTSRTIQECGRKPIGKKGLGKLAFFGIAQKGVIETTKDNKKVTFPMDRDKINSSNGDYKVACELEDVPGARSGTTVTLSGIKRKTPFSLGDLSKSLSNYFIFDQEFKVFIKQDDSEYVEIDNELRYQYDDRRVRYTWSFPDTALDQNLKQFDFSNEIKGKIMVFDKPVKSDIRGVTLFSRKKLVSLPELFPVQGSGYFFQYLTGWLEVDFIDDLETDVIATDRSGLAWNDDSLAELKEFLEILINHLIQEWKKLIAKAADDKIKKRFHIDPANWRKTNKNNPVISKNLAKLTPILEDPEAVPEEELMNFVEIIYNLAPEYADFMLWRNLNSNLRDNDTVKDKFFAGQYLEAAREAVQLYEAAVRKVAGSSKYGQGLMGSLFGRGRNKNIWVTDRADQSKEDIEEGQKFLSMGIITGFKNPAVSHASITEGLANGNFSDRDCLDILSTISYLYTRLENRVQPR